jgi:hypothetical protein
MVALVIIKSGDHGSQPAIVKPFSPLKIRSRAKVAGISTSSLTIWTKAKVKVKVKVKFNIDIRQRPCDDHLAPANKI